LKKKIKELEAKGSEIFIGNLNHKEDIEKSIKDCYGVFILQNPLEEPKDACWSPEEEYNQGKLIGDVIAESGAENIRHIVHACFRVSTEDTTDTKAILNEYIDKNNITSILNIDKNNLMYKNINNTNTNTTTNSTTNNDTNNNANNENNENNENNDNNNKKKITFLNVKEHVESYLREEKQLPVTNIYTPFPLEIIFHPTLLSKITENNKELYELALPLPLEGGRIPFASIRDLGPIAATIFERPAEYTGRWVYLPSEALYLEDLRPLFRKVFNKKLKFIQPTFNDEDEINGKNKNIEPDIKENIKKQKKKRIVEGNI